MAEYGSETEPDTDSDDESLPSTPQPHEQGGPINNAQNNNNAQQIITHSASGNKSNNNLLNEYRSQEYGARKLTREIINETGKEEDFDENAPQTISDNTNKRRRVIKGKERLKRGGKKSRKKRRKTKKGKSKRRKGKTRSKRRNQKKRRKTKKKKKNNTK